MQELSEPIDPRQTAEYVKADPNTKRELMSNFNALRDAHLKAKQTAQLQKEENNFLKNPLQHFESLVAQLALHSLKAASYERFLGAADYSDRIAEVQRAVARHKVAFVDGLPVSYHYDSRELEIDITFNSASHEDFRAMKSNIAALADMLDSCSYLDDDVAKKLSADADRKSRNKLRKELQALVDPKYHAVISATEC